MPPYNFPSPSAVKHIAIDADFRTHHTRRGGGGEGGERGEREHEGRGGRKGVRAGGFTKSAHAVGGEERRGGAAVTPDTV
jgi:hypothetical protein